MHFKSSFIKWRLERLKSFWKLSISCFLDLEISTCKNNIAIIACGIFFSFQTNKWVLKHVNIFKFVCRGINIAFEIEYKSLPNIFLEGFFSQMKFQEIHHSLNPFLKFLSRYVHWSNLIYFIKKYIFYFSM